MGHITSAKAILCILILSCGIVVANEFGGGEQWSSLNIVARNYGRPSTMAQPASSRSSQGWGNTSSCADPAPEEAPSCRSLEQQILSSTVRIEIEAWISRPAGREGSGLHEVRPVYGNGHGTVRDGRYLITHDHFDVPLAASGAASSGDAPLITFGTVAAYAANGERLAMQAEPASLRVVSGGEETLVLDFGLVGDVGFFEAAGLTSAHFKSWPALPLQAGMEVAQVNWDGKTTRVQWSTVEAVVTEDSPPRLALSRGLTRGASGGGVFWNGYHVANNWALVETVAADGHVSSRRSIAALNEAASVAR